MPLNWSPFVELVRCHTSFLMTTHMRPDGDGLGSMLALADTLQQHGKTVHLTVGSAIPPRYDFLDPGHLIHPFVAPGDEYRNVDAAIVLDTGTWNQLGEVGTFIKALDVPKVVIDHHLTQDDLGAMQLVDITAEATGRLAHEAIMALGGPLRPVAAQGLFVALAMDTGWFRHSNTRAATFALAAELTAAGANPTNDYELLFEQTTEGRLRLMSKVLGRLRVCCQGKVAYTEVHRTDYAETGAIPQDSEDLVNYTRSLIGVEVGLFILEQPAGGVKISFRSRRVDVSKIAEQFGGGGHKLASGVILETSLEEARRKVLAAVAIALECPPT